MVAWLFLLEEGGGKMKKHQKQILALAVILVFTATVLLLAGLSEAGKSEKPDPVMDKLEELQDSFDTFDLHLVVSEPDDGYDGHAGFITADLISTLVGSVDDKRFFLCGPEEMYRLVVKELVVNNSLILLCKIYRLSM